VIGTKFDYHTPPSAETAVALLGDLDGDVEIIGGGTWVVPEMTHGTRQPGHIVDLSKAGLSEIEADVGGLKVGATATYSVIASSALVLERAPLLAAMASGITGGAQVRNQGTIGGSACYATPSSDVPGALVALDARLRLASGGGLREVDAVDFFTGAFESDLQAGEVLTEIHIPEAPDGARYGYYKLKFCESSWPIATSGCVLALAGDGTVESARLAVGGVSTRPYLVDTSGLVGSGVDDASVEAISAAAQAAATDPYTDVLADGSYRQQVAGVVAKRAVLDATA